MSRRPARVSTVLTLRVTPDLNSRLAREAKRRRRTRSQTARALLESVLTTTAGDPAAEARRQSRLASGRAADQDVLEFIASAADLRGWK